MTVSRIAIAAGLAAALAAGALSVAGRAATEDVNIPADYRTKFVRYTTVDRADIKQVRDLYVTPEAIAAARAGRPLPSGTVIVLEAYRAQLDAAGNPVKDANGRFVKGDLAAVNLMEKRTGWGLNYPPELRNGEWEYASFTAAGVRAENRNMTPCLQCHLPKKDDDYLFTLGPLKESR